MNMVNNLIQVWLMSERCWFPKPSTLRYYECWAITTTLSDHNYIEGVTFTHTKEGVLYSFQDARITIEGLEYLAENSMMQKAFRIFKSFKEWL